VEEKKGLERKMWDQFDSEVQTEISEWTKIKEKV
jgi:hypothetical protein